MDDTDEHLSGRHKWVMDHHHLVAPRAPVANCLFSKSVLQQGHEDEICIRAMFVQLQAPTCSLDQRGKNDVHTTAMKEAFASGGDDERVPPSPSVRGKSAPSRTCRGAGHGRP